MSLTILLKLKIINLFIIIFFFHFCSKIGKFSDFPEKFRRLKAISPNIDFEIQIYAYARCEGKNVKNANLLNTMYWAAFGVHRFLAVFLAKYIQPIRYMALALGCKFSFF